MESLGIRVWITRVGQFLYNPTIIWFLKSLAKYAGHGDLPFDESEILTL